jgi:hypothetical protein
MIFGELNAAVSLLDRLRKWVSPKRPPETIASRLVQLFEAHGVNRNQIPRVVGHGLRPIDVHSDSALLGVLTDTLLDAAAKLFAIRREWLECASEQIYPLHDFYKHPEKFATFVDDLAGRSTNGHPAGVVLTANSNDHEDTALIVMEEPIGFVGDMPLYRYHLCHNWSFNYWKSRAYLTACVASAWNRDVSLMGREVPIEVIRTYRDGCRFLEYSLDGALPTKGRQWHPEDLAINPERFLEGLDEGAFGMQQGLQLWLHLEASGWMETGLPYQCVRAEFERALNERPSPSTA